jgi:hypothetical protein
MKVAQKLDYNLQAYQERVGLVNFLAESGELDGYPPSELDKVANYLLYAEDVDAEVELKKGSKKKVSYEELIESTLGESTVQRNKELSIYKIPKPRIDRELDADIPGMKDLWEAIDNLTEQYQYCKDVLDEFHNPDKSVIFITSSSNNPELYKAARDVVETYGFENIYETQAGCIVSSHCGENTIGILYINDAE